ncbi:hypothetical protein KO561_18890 [Radiobacillus kanasensis]|uniref:hypothetical protein n=1 Tax=Radiobacillus kanasensis TaxID=2844358 RepID=UPI001E5E7E5C|nr:hypothetical protein [Radiobacillus kanasensis]UFT99216.1 hypothetical protein KO561_18890 [Radiobacillus kanasensis]
MSRYYGICRKSIGRRVLIKTHCGRTMRGIIHRVDDRNVYLRPIGPSRIGGFGYGYRPYGYGYGYRPYGWGWGLGWGIALSAIASLFFI